MDALATMEASSMTGAMQTARTLAQSQLIPRALQGKPADVLVVLLTGRELGLGPMQALRSVHVIDGKAVLSADLVVALCLRDRTVCEWFRLVASDDKLATYEAKRVGAPEPTRMSFTMEQAKQANLVGKQNWRTFPAAMLRARCAVALARAVFPDLAMGVYDPDELEQPKPEAAPPSPAPQPSRREAVEAEVVPAEGTVRAPSPAVAREAQRVAEAVGGQVVPPGYESTEQRVAKAGGPVMLPTLSFGPHRGRALSELSDDELSGALDLGRQKLEAEPKARWANGVQANLGLVEAEVERRMTRMGRTPGADV